MTTDKDSLQKQKGRDDFDCSYCKKCISQKKKQDFCECNICENCMKEYFRTRLIKGKVIRHCPKDRDHIIYMDTLLQKDIYRELFFKNKGKVHYMILTIFLICLVLRYFLSTDRVLQIAFCILIIYHIKADVNPKQKYYFVYAMYIPIVYWFSTKSDVTLFLEMMSPLHVLWFTFVHIESERKEKIKIFIVWVSQIVWQLLFTSIRYYFSYRVVEILS